MRRDVCACKKTLRLSLAMMLARNLLITVLALYCFYVVFGISSNAGIFFLPLLFVLPPLIFKGKK